VASDEGAPVSAIYSSEELLPSVPREIVAVAGDGFVNLMWKVPSSTVAQPIKNYHTFVSKDGLSWTKVSCPRTSALTERVIPRLEAG